MPPDCTPDRSKRAGVLPGARRSCPLASRLTRVAAGSSGVHERLPESIPAMGVGVSGLLLSLLLPLLCLDHFYQHTVNCTLLLKGCSSKASGWCRKVEAKAFEALRGRF